MRQKRYLPNVPFVEARYKGGRQRPRAIVIQSSMTSSESGAALAIANRWHRSNSPEYSCHYVIDEDKAYRCVPDRNVAFNSAQSKGIIGVYVCYEPVSFVDFWQDSDYSSLLDRTAKLVAQLLLAHGIRPAYAKNGRVARGIVIDVQGSWPSEHFLNEVKRHMSILKTKK